MEETKCAAFAMGCFWHPDEIFSKVPGVKRTTVGYGGGHTPNPTYEMVCSAITGHAETIEIEYDPDQVSYEQLLKIFWENHDPTQKNRQGSDLGQQYRSAIFYFDEEQRRLAEQSKQKYQKKLSKPIATKIEPAKIFYAAEAYHQKYLEKRRGMEKDSNS